jgi:hypothetical protein
VIDDVLICGWRTIEGGADDAMDRNTGQMVVSRSLDSGVRRSMSCRADGRVSGTHLVDRPPRCHGRGTARRDIRPRLQFRKFPIGGHARPHVFSRMASCSPVQGYLGIPRNGPVRVIVCRREVVRLALPCARNTPIDWRMCEVRVKKDEGQSTLSLRLLVRNNINVGYAGCNRSIQALH